MSGPPDNFEQSTDAVSDVRRAETGSYLHEYTGVLAETDERVRLFTLAPDVTHIDAAADAFSRVSDTWYNASANANIRTIRDRGTEPRPWIAVPDHDGDTLATLQPELSPDAVDRIISETADALRTLGLYNTVNGYLSPDDIYLTGVDGAGELTVEVGGFGLEAALQAAAGEFEPTAYTAPELLDGPDQPTEQADVYGLGAITYFVLTGSPPVEGADIAQAIRDGPSVPPSATDDAIPAALDAVVMRALSTRPADRYDSPYAFSRAFQSTFVPDEFRTAGTDEDNAGETETAGSAESDGDDDEVETARSTESGETVPDEDGEASPADEEVSAASGDTDGTTVTRRAAVGLLGVGVLGGAGWYLSTRWTTSQQSLGQSGTTQSPPAGPSASLTVTPSSPTVGDAVTLSAAESTVGEGVTFDSYSWEVSADGSLVSSMNSRTPSEDFTFSNPGRRTVRLEVVDSRGRTDTASTTLTVQRRASGLSMFQYNPANTGHSSDETGPTDSVSQQWAFDTGDTVISSPAVVDGIVYVGSWDNNIYALDARSGTERWAFETGDSVFSSPAVVDGTVYIGSRDNTLYALNAADGTERWAYWTGYEEYNVSGDPIDSPPVVVDDTVYVGCLDRNVYAIDVSDGSRQWSFTTRNRVRPSPAVVDGTVYVGSDGGNVYSLDADDGTERWAFETGDWVETSPTVVDGTVYVGSRDRTVYALDAADGTVEWTFDTGDFVGSSPAVVDGTVFVSSWDNTVYALDATDGTEQWRFETGDSVYSSPAVVDDTVYIGSEDSNVYALDTSDGTERWRFETGDGVFSSPAVVDGTVYVGSRDNSVYALTER